MAGREKSNEVQSKLLGTHIDVLEYWLKAMKSIRDEFEYFAETRFDYIYETY
jgi:hypothetical protein